jgi:multiple sugar transport system permease protein
MGKGGQVMTNQKEKIGNGLCHVYLIILSVIAFFPLVWVLLCSVKSSGELTANPTRFLPKHFTLENFTHVIQDLGFAGNISNSLIIAISTTCIAIVVSSMAAYGIVRFFPKLGSIMSKVLVATYMFPPILLAIPYSMVMAKLGFVNTRVGLVIVYLSFSVPYAVWMLVGFFKTVPLGIEEAARVDGANKLQTFVRIVLPLVMPGIVATAIYTFINAWNEFLYSLILINSTDKMTVSVALKSLQGSEILNWGDMMAASALVVVPSVIFFMFIQNKIAGGMTDGAVK